MEEWRYVVLHIQSQCISLQQLAHYNQLLAPSIMILGSANPTALTLLASTDMARHNGTTHCRSVLLSSSAEVN